MYVHIPGDLTMSTIFNSRCMRVQNADTIASGPTVPTPSSVNTATTRGSYKIAQPIIDLVVAITIVPVLISCGLKIEEHLHEPPNTPNSVWQVFALALCMVILGFIFFSYTTHRIGMCIYGGVMEEVTIRNESEGSNDNLRIVEEQPPSYDSVIKSDIAPPPYDCLVIDMEQCKDEPGNRR